MTLAIESSAERLKAQRQVLELLTRIGTALIVGLAMFKGSVSLAVFPGWDMDPMSVASPLVGLGPTATLSIDCALLTLAGAVIALSSALVGRFAAVELLLFACGCAAVMWHGVFSERASQENLLIGTGWMAAMGVAIALAHAARLESVRRIGAAVALGFVGALAVKGAMQVWDETPQTIEAYKAGREAILASHGWSPDSFAARAFERRLYDAVATGWFGLSNVVATFGAGGVGAFSVLLMRERGGKRRLQAGIGLCAGVVCLWLAGSKGGWGAAAIGLGVGMCGPWFAGRSRVRGALMMVGLPLLAIGAIGARGLIGERMSELSLLFRSQYLGAAAKIFAGRPATGVGPAGFKDAYLLAKSPLSPEEVSSPHNILFEFAATLGTGGLAWGVLWLALIGLAGANLKADADEETGLAERSSDERAREAFRFGAIALAGATVGSAWVESAIATPLGGFARIAGLLIGLAIAWRVCIAGGRALRIALCAGAAAYGVHAMIEVTPVQSGSAPLFAALIGLAAARTWDDSERVRRGVLVRAIPGLFVSVLGIVASLSVGRVQRWEWALLAGSERLAPIASLTNGLGASSGEKEIAEAAAELSRMLGAPVAANREAVRNALLEARRKAGAQAYEDLIVAISADPTSQATRQAASNLSLQLGALAREGGTPDARRLRSALDLAEDGARLPWHRASSQAWLGTALEGVWGMTRDPAALDRAFGAAVKTSGLDPANPIHAAKAARLAREMGNSVAAAEWAERALRLDENMRLDPLRRFEPKERADLEGMKKGGR